MLVGGKTILYTYGGSHTEGYLGQEQVLKVEARIASKVEDSKRGRQRAKLCTPLVLTVVTDTLYLL